MIMVSITAFRSVFLARDSRASGNKARPWCSSAVARFRKNSNLVEDHDLPPFHAIPVSTTPSVRTFIRGSRLEDGLETYDRTSCYELSRRSSSIMVTQDVSWEEEVSSGGG